MSPGAPVPRVVSPAMILCPPVLPSFLVIFPLLLLFFKINPTILFFYWTSSDGGRKREESPPETPPLATRPFRRYTSRPWPGLLTFPSHQRQAYVPRF